MIYGFGKSNRQYTILLSEIFNYNDDLKLLERDSMQYLFSFSRLTNFQEAASIVRIADRRNDVLLLDTLYFYFSNIRLDELTTLPSEWFHFLHINDAVEEIPTTREGMIGIARDERLCIGEGSIDLGQNCNGCQPFHFRSSCRTAKRSRNWDMKGMHDAAWRQPINILINTKVCAKSSQFCTH